VERDLEITLTVNGTEVTRRVAARTHLVDFLREDLGLTGSHIGCEHGVCGACTVRVEGDIVRGCLMLAVQADGKKVDTIEGLTDSKELAALQKAFYERNALQSASAPRGCSWPPRISCGKTRKRHVRKFAPTFPETIAAAPATRPSWTRSRK